MRRRSIYERPFILCGVDAPEPLRSENYEETTKREETQIERPGLPAGYWKRATLIDKLRNFLYREAKCKMEDDGRYWADNDREEDRRAEEEWKKKLETYGKMKNFAETHYDNLLLAGVVTGIGGLIGGCGGFLVSSLDKNLQRVYESHQHLALECSAIGACIFGGIGILASGLIVARMYSDYLNVKRYLEKEQDTKR